MEKNIIKIFTCFLLVLMISCHSDLKEELKSSLTQENLTSPMDASNLVLGIYHSLLQGGWGYYGNGGIVKINDGISDIMQFKDESVVDEWNWDNDVASDIWEGAFETINRANSAIDVINKQVSFNGNSADSLKLLSEAKFLRALAYYDLTLAFGDVPLLLTPTEGEIYPSRTPIADVYEQIDEDLEEARLYLPVLNPGKLTVGRATKGAALALSAKFYARQHMYDEALTYINELQDLTVYDLYTESDYKDLWLESRKKDNEYIFVVMSYGMNYDVANHHIKSFTPWTFDAGWSGTGFPWSFYQKTSEDDERRGVLHSHWLYYSGSDYGFQSYELYYSTWELYIDGVYHTPWWGNVPGVVCSKFSGYNRDETAFGDPTDKYGVYGASSLNSPVLRYADILLLKAEAINEVNGSPTAEAYEAINEVRMRSNATSLSGLGYADFKQAVLDERAVELCFEGHRKEDLIRNDVFEEVMSKYLGKPVEEKYRLFPIPSQELLLNPNMEPNETNN